MTNFKPLLAVPAEAIEFPILASVKIDGIRGCILPKYGLVSRKIKPIPNRYIRGTLNNSGLDFQDGEILTFTDGKMDDFNTVQSKVMTEEGTPDFQYFMFDNFEYPLLEYELRAQRIKTGIERTKVVTQIPVYNQQHLDELEAKAVTDGWEGLILRSLKG